MSLARAAMFLFSLFQGDVRMGVLSAQGRLCAWRCLLFLAELHDRQAAGQQQQQQPAGQAAAAAADPAMRRRRFQRESVATSKGRRSVRHAFLLDRSGAARAAAAAAPAAAAASSAAGSSFSPGAADEWAEAEEEPGGGPCAAARDEALGEVAAEPTRQLPTISPALSLQRQLQQGQPATLGFEPHFTRFVGGTIDRRWALQQRHLRIPAEAQRADAAAAAAAKDARDEPLDLLLEEFGAATAPKMWPRADALPERVFVGLPIQVATWVGWGRSEAGDSGRMLWRDCEVVQLLQGGDFRARCFTPGEPKDFVCHVRDFVPSRMPCPCPRERAWRLLPPEVDPSRDIYPGACLSVGLTVSNPSQQEPLPADSVVRAYFVDVVVQDVYFSLDQASRAKNVMAESREREEGGAGRTVLIGRRLAGCAEAAGPVEGLRPNCLVRAMRVMVLRTGGASNEFALVAGRIIYKLPYDLFNNGIFKEPGQRPRLVGGSSFVWAIPRALTPAAPDQMRRSGCAGISGSGGDTAEANAKRWQYKTQEDSREWTFFPPFIVIYMPYDGSARHILTHPLLLRYLQPELDFSALLQGTWRLCLPQYEHSNVPPVLLPHPSDAQQPERSQAATRDPGEGSAEGVVVLDNPYHTVRSTAAPVAESRSAASSEDMADPMYAATHAAEPPQPVVSGQGAPESAARASVLGINHLASLLCSGGDSAPPRELLAKALPFFRGLLPHLAAANVPAVDWQLDVARAAVRAADQAKELYVEEQETEAERLRKQGISFAGTTIHNSNNTEGGRSQRGLDPSGAALEPEGSESWEWVGNTGSRYPTSSDISRFLLRTSGHSMGSNSAVRGRSVEAGGAQVEGGGVSGAAGGSSVASRRRPHDPVAGFLSGNSRRGSGSELGAGGEGRGRGEEGAYITRGSSVAECDFHGSRRTAGPAAAVRVCASEDAAGLQRARGLVSPATAAATALRPPGGVVGASPGASCRRAVTQREEEEEFQPSLRGAGAAAAATAAAAARQSSGSGRAGTVRRATRNVSYAALAGVEAGPDDPAYYRPLKRMARGEPPTALDPTAPEAWDPCHPREAALTAGTVCSDSHHNARASLQQWAALQRQVAVAEERLRQHSQSSHLPDRAADASISTDQLHEALKGFVQSFKAGASPAVVSVPPMARDRSFAASH